MAAGKTACAFSLPTYMKSGKTLMYVQKVFPDDFAGIESYSLFCGPGFFAIILREKNLYC